MENANKTRRYGQGGFDRNTRCISRAETPGVSLSYPRFDHEIADKTRETRPW